MDSLVRTRDSTRASTTAHWLAHYGPTTGPAGQALVARKISKAERTPMAHRERTGSALVNAQE